MIPDFGWSELLMIGIVLIVVIGPKDLPKVLRGFGQGMKSVRKMSDDFRKQFSQALDEAELSDIKNLAKDAKALDPRNAIKDALAPLGAVGQDLNREVRKAAGEIEAASKDDDEIEAPAVNPPKPMTPTGGQKAMDDWGAKARAAQPAKGKAAAEDTGDVTDPEPVGDTGAPQKATASKASSAKGAATKSRSAPTAAARAKAKADDSVGKATSGKAKSTSAKSTSAKTTSTKTTSAKATAAKTAASKTAASKTTTRSKSTASKSSAATDKAAPKTAAAKSTARKAPDNSESSDT